MRHRTPKVPNNGVRIKSFLALEGSPLFDYGVGETRNAYPAPNVILSRAKDPVAATTGRTSPAKR
jgi:hypothetical protein